VVEAADAARVVEYYIELPDDSSFKHHKRHKVVVPGAGQPWHWAFCSCNGFDDPKKGPDVGGILPMWRDVLHVHAQVCVCVGGGAWVLLWCAALC
jgi:hypothetical protein